MATIISDDTTTAADGSTTRTIVYSDTSRSVQFTPGPGTPGANQQEIHAKAVAALTANETDLAQDASIRTQALALAATTGNRTAAQLSGDVRALANALAVLAQNDMNSKRELGALIRLMLGLLDSTDGT